MNEKLIKALPKIFTAIGVIGTAGTAYTMYADAERIKDGILEAESEKGADLTFGETALIVMKKGWRTCLVAGATMSSDILAQHLNGKQIAALSAALTVAVAKRKALEETIEEVLDGEQVQDIYSKAEQKTEQIVKEMNDGTRDEMGNPIYTFKLDFIEGIDIFVHTSWSTMNKVKLWAETEFGKNGILLVTDILDQFPKSSVDIKQKKHRIGRERDKILIKNYGWLAGDDFFENYGPEFGYSLAWANDENDIVCDENGEMKYIIEKSQTGPDFIQPLSNRENKADWSMAMGTRAFQIDSKL